MYELNPSSVAELKKGRRPFPDVERGVLVPQVIPGSPAEKAGFAEGDVIIKFNGKDVRRSEDIYEELGHEIGKTHRVEVARVGGRRILDVKTEEGIS